MQHDVGQPGKLPMRAHVLLMPALKSSGKLTSTVLHVCPRHPRLDGGAANVQEDPLAFVLNGRQPGGVASQSGAADAHFEFPFDIRRQRLETREADQGSDFAQAMH